MGTLIEKSLLHDFAAIQEMSPKTPRDTTLLVPPVTRTTVNASEAYLCSGIDPRTESACNSKNVHCPTLSHFMTLWSCRSYLSRLFLDIGQGLLDILASFGAFAQSSHPHT